MNIFRQSGEGNVQLSGVEPVGVTPMTLGLRLTCRPAIHRQWLLWGLLTSCRTLRTNLQQKNRLDNSSPLLRNA